MNLYRLRNKAGRGTWVFSPSEERAREILVSSGAARRPQNLTVCNGYPKPCPDTFHEGLGCFQLSPGRGWIAIMPGDGPAADRHFQPDRDWNPS